MSLEKLLEEKNPDLFYSLAMLDEGSFPKSGASYRQMFDEIHKANKKSEERKNNEQYKSNDISL